MPSIKTREKVLAWLAVQEAAAARSSLESIDSQQTTVGLRQGRLPFGLLPLPVLCFAAAPWSGTL